MKILHICNNYFSSRVHQNLSSALSDKVEAQFFFVPIKLDVNVSYKETSDIMVFRYPRFLRYFPLIKCLYVSLAILRNPAARSIIQQVDKVVAHNFWSDGAVAYFLSLIFKFDFLLVIRNTDMNIFIPKLIYHRWFMKLMIRSAVSIVFISKAHHVRFRQHFLSLYRQMRDKCTVIPNGIDKYWIENCIQRSVYRSESVLFVGRFVEGKNLNRLISACVVVKEKRTGLTLTLVGGSLAELERLLNEPLPNFVKVIESIKEPSLLMNYYRSARVFAMPSIGETFGLTYVEAISQGCPIICSEGEGVDGMFPSKFALAVNPLSITSIAHAIDRMCDTYPGGISVDFVIDTMHSFDWNLIANTYTENLV